MMRKFLILVTALLCGTCLWAQTPEEIVDKMMEQLQRTEAEGFTMDLNMKVPIVGWVRTHNASAGDKLRSEINGNGKSHIIWQDKTTQWDYDKQAGEITIKAADPSTATSNDADLSDFQGITEGYDLTLKKETADAWYILCKKSKSNKDKDDPKKMDLVVSKATYLPISMTMKQSVVTVSIENITLGVSEKSVTFDPAAYPNATIIDKR